MRVSVIICTTGREKLQDCLDSIERQSFSNFETMVISNSDLESDLKERDLRFLKTENRNLSQQRNLGVEESEGEILAFIDDDAEACEEWLENIVRHYRDEDVMCTGGKVKPKFSSEVPEDLKELDKHIFYGLIGATFIEWDEAKEIESPLIWGCNISFRKTVFEEIGRFPKELGRDKGKLMSEEERYLQIKILENNYKIIYDPRAVIKHHIDSKRLSEKYLLKRSFWQGVSEAKRIDISGGLKKLAEYKKEIEKIGPFKFLEKNFEISASKDLKERIDLARKTGRLAGVMNFLGVEDEEGKDRT
ncbi:MAG: glycosyltransferase family 2 protein [Candidatus Aenigmatarchaeota archaeon]